MRKQTVILTVVAVFCLTMMLGACGITTTVSKLQSVSVDAQNAKTEYFTGEEFTAEGITVTAEFKAANKNELDKKVLSADEYVVNSSSYNKFQQGVYTIKVSYAYDGETKTASYDVTVKEREYDGISVQLADGVEETYHLSAPVEINTADIVVKQTDENGNLLDEVVDASTYTATLYKGKTQVELTDGKANIEEAGAYQIWVEKPSTVQPFYTLKAFVTIYVLDDPLTLTWDNTAEGTLATQEEGDDVISETWQFTVTYESGKTKTVSSKDVKFTVKPDTATVGENLTASAVYSEVNAKSEKVESAEATVTYTVTERKQGNEPTVNNFSLQGLIDVLTAANGGTAPADRTQLKPEDFTGANSFIKLSGEYGKDEVYRTASKGCIEIKKGTLDVTFKGTGTLTVSFASTSGTNNSRISVVDDKGNFLTAKQTTGTVIEDGIYEVVGTTFATVTYEITTPGVYSICTKLTKETPASRAVRINGISMVDTPAQEEAKTETYNFSYDELKAVLTKENNGAEPADKTPLKPEHFTGSNAFITLVGSSGKNSDAYRSDKKNFFEIKGATLTVTFKGTGTLTVSFASTGGSNDSRLYVADSTGKLLSAKDTTATQVADGDEAGSYQVTGTTFVPVTFEITEPGTYTIGTKTVVTTRGMRINAISMTDTPIQSSVTVDTYNFNYQGLVEAMTTALGNAPADKTLLTADYFTGDNAFLKLTAVDKNDQYRTSGGGCFEIKKGTLQVTFKGTGTITVSFASTSGTNNSRLAVKDSTGKYLVAKETAAASVEEGVYEVIGTSYVTVTYEITEAGTYTICSDHATTGRGMRINAISMTDNH